MHDDHFLVIEAAGSWVDGKDYNHWLPWSPENRGGPEGHSFTYVGLNFFLIYICKFIGIGNPSTIMLFNRLAHAAWSVLVVLFGIKIADKLGGTKIGVTVGWLLALTWLIPFLSVRNLVEVACVPLLVLAIWLVIKDGKGTRFLWAGLLLGMAVSFRYQVGVFALGLAFVLFFQKKFKAFLILSAGVLITFFITQGAIDYLIWGYPFAEFHGYVTYNLKEGMEYIPNQNPFAYLLVLAGVFLVPLGILLTIGFFRSFKKYALIFVPTFSFLAFHSFYPSKQERFIMPILVFFLILGILGFEKLKENLRWKRFWNISIRTFWVLNIPLLLFASFTYTKKSRVEAMQYFYDENTVAHRILLETTGESAAPMLPYFYAGYWSRSQMIRHSLDQPLNVLPYHEYDFIFFFGQEKLEERINSYKSVYPKMKLEKVCDPSLVDKFLRWLNPRNTNEYIEIWATGEKVS